MSGLDRLAIGLGLDTHRLAPGIPLMLGGLHVPFEQGLVAHSDGDVLLHAILDALLSASHEPDLGTLFPDNDERARGRASSGMAHEVARRLAASGTRILSLDAVLVCEKPRIAPLRDALRASIAGLFGIAVSRVNVKGKTAEGLGPIGRGECIECRAVALVERGPGAD